jgi:hypothetical protein
MKLVLALRDGAGNIVARGCDFPIHTETTTERLDAQGRPVYENGVPVVDRVVAPLEGGDLSDPTLFNGLSVVLLNDKGAVVFPPDRAKDDQAAKDRAAKEQQAAADKAKADQLAADKAKADAAKDRAALDAARDPAGHEPGLI